MSNLVKALNSFSGFKGAAMPTDPTNQTEFAALKNAVDGGSCWSGSAPTWDQVAAKVAEFDKEDKDARDLKVSAYKKNGLTDAEIAAILP